MFGHSGTSSGLFNDILKARQQPGAPNPDTAETVKKAERVEIAKPPIIAAIVIVGTGVLLLGLYGIRICLIRPLNPRP